jgi:DNA-binding HxlR family transcriptional regulator
VSEDGSADVDEVCAGQFGDVRMIRDILARVSDKWSLLVMGILDNRRRRFGEIHRAIPGISQRMLTHTLRQLEREGLVTRTAWPEIPPRVEYEVTALGRTLIHPMHAMVTWVVTHRDEVLASRDSYDERMDAAVLERVES